MLSDWGRCAPNPDKKEAGDSCKMAEDYLKEDAAEGILYYLYSSSLGQAMLEDRGTAGLRAVGLDLPCSCFVLRQC
jgi:hypothetical protein